MRIEVLKAHLFLVPLEFSLFVLPVFRKRHRIRDEQDSVQAKLKNVTGMQSPECCPPIPIVIRSFCTCRAKLCIRTPSALNIAVYRFAMGRIFTTELSAEHKTSPIAHVLLGLVLFIQ